ncbi:MAG: 50S ribosomal protein L23 [Bacillota bacterium]|nr:50S ribosomal protein L23 [Bacillota bacterium]
MKSPEDIILKPVITERSTYEAAWGRYTFVVAKSATKPEIRRAVEALFNVKVLTVNTMNFLGKRKRLRYRQEGKRPDWKKAVVTIDTQPEPETWLDEGGRKRTSERKYREYIEEFGIGQ